MSQTPPLPPFAMVGDTDAAVCVDGVCELPAAPGADDDGATAPPAPSG